ncbi:hypothetical protein EVAR_60105_1 [Eumeta japonica]|uniref:Uncharacterized protein n=1 Tax=Eumeta variegata TaxID=151549 RepID=A0A4C1Z2W2_EUMVA|nr:hypothetical protein EVAR_60105_1 [Eumeta japonica]
MLWSIWPQHKNGLVRPVRYRTLTECKREVTASAFLPVSESFRGPLPTPLPYFLLHHLATLSLILLSLYYISYFYPRGRQRPGDPMKFRVSMSGGDHVILYGGLRGPLPL